MPALWPGIFTNDELHNALKFPWRQRGEQRDGITASRASAFFLSRYLPADYYFASSMPAMLLNSADANLIPRIGAAYLNGRVCDDAKISAGTVRAIHQLTPEE